MGEKKKENGVRLKFKALITDCRWYSEETNWGIFSFTTPDDVSHELLQEDFFSSNKKAGEIVGNVQKLQVGSEYTLEVEVEYNKKYRKDQFKPVRASMDLPTTKDQQERFLRSILTSNQVDSLLVEYPNIVQDVIDNKPINVSLLNGIGEVTIQSIKDKIVDNYVLIDLLSILSPYGVTYNQIKKISELSDNPILIKEMIEKNPYSLTQIKGFGFKKVDGIALKLNKELKVSRFRAIEYIKYILEDEADSIGHTWIKRISLISKARKDVNECIDIIKAILDEEELSPTFLKIDGDKVGLLVNYNTERAILRELERINNAQPIIQLPSDDEFDRIVRLTEEQQGFKLSEEQYETVMSMKDDGNIMVISGSAGTGKSTVAKTIVNILESSNRHNFSLLQMALSAKAAKRINEVTNRPSVTIHRGLKFNGKEFKHNENNKLPTNVVIFDEFSMVNIGLTLSVLKAIKSGALLIFMFDYAQLPAIGSGAVAYDLLESMRYKTSKYTQVHRQAEKSGILCDANKIRRQKSPIKSYEKSITTGELKDMTYFFRQSQEEIHSLAIKYYLSGIEKYGVDNINIVTARKDKVLNSADSLNKKIQEAIVPKIEGKYITSFYNKIEFRVSDRVIHKKNDYDKGVFNGETGVVIDVTRDYIGDSMQDILVVDFGADYDDSGNEIGHKIIKYTKQELDDLRLSYALTVHSFQGSENKAIIVVLDSSAYVLLDSTLLYTAITRAKERCLLISDTNSFKTCIRENKTIVRNTYLKELLEEVSNG